MMKTTPQTKRVPYWDTMKGFLIILVVLGHFLWDFATPDHRSIKFLVESIYFFSYACICIYLRLLQP